MTEVTNETRSGAADSWLLPEPVRSHMSWEEWSAGFKLKGDSLEPVPCVRHWHHPEVVKAGVTHCSNCGAQLSFVPPNKEGV